MINVLFFGFIAERLQQQALQLPITEKTCLRDVIEQVGCNEMQPFMLAVNQVQEHDLNRLLKNGDELAIMPPFSGG